MSLLLSWLSGSDQLQCAFDAVPTITPAETATITRHPVEKGADVADHIQLAARKLSFEAVVTNTPLSTPATHTRGAKGEVLGLENIGPDGASVLQFDGSMDRPRDVYLDLRDAYQAKSVFTVDTALERYDDMVITGLTSPREAGSGRETPSGTRIDLIKFSIEMEQVRVVGSREGKVTRKPKKGNPKPKTNKGSQPKKEATELESAAHQALY